MRKGCAKVILLLLLLYCNSKSKYILTDMERENWRVAAAHSTFLCTPTARTFTRVGAWYASARREPREQDPAAAA